MIHLFSSCFSLSWWTTTSIRALPSKDWCIQSLVKQKCEQSLHHLILITLKMIVLSTYKSIGSFAWLPFETEMEEEEIKQESSSFCPCNTEILVKFWSNWGQIVVNSFVAFASQCWRFQVKFWPLFGHFLANSFCRFCLPMLTISGQIWVKFWPNFGHLLVNFWSIHLVANFMP